MRRVVAVVAAFVRVSRTRLDAKWGKRRAIYLPPSEEGGGNSRLCRGLTEGVTASKACHTCMQS